MITIDIETACENGFPDPKTAIEPLICITVKSHSTKDIIVFGIGEYKNDNEKVTYLNFTTEQELLEAFIKFWQEEYWIVAKTIFTLRLLCNQSIPRSC